MDSGWIKLHRKFLKWEWYNDMNTKAVFIHLLLNANFEERKWKGQVIEVGEVVTSVNSLSKELKLSVKQVRTALEHLKSTNEVAIKTANKYSVIKLCNYGIYQDFDLLEGQTKGQAEWQSNGKQGANKGQTKGNQRATPKEIKNLRNKEVKNKEKDIYGEYQHVMLTEEEMDRLFKDYGEMETMEAIKLLDEYLETHPRKIKEYKNHSLVMRNWVFNAVKEKRQREAKIQNFGNSRKPQTEEDFFSGLSDWAKNYGGEEVDGQEAVFGNGGGS